MQKQGHASRPKAPTRKRPASDRSAAAKIPKTRNDEEDGEEDGEENGEEDDEGGVTKDWAAVHTLLHAKAGRLGDGDDITYLCQNVASGTRWELAEEVRTHWRTDQEWVSDEARVRSAEAAMQTAREQGVQHS